MKNQRISLQICTKNRAPELGMFLTSLLNQTYTSWDLILCDGSEVPMIQHKFIHDIIVRLKMQDHGVCLVKDNGFGVCEARNLCAEKDPWKSELILRIDDDSICDDQYIERLYNIMTQGLIKTEDREYRIPNEGEIPDVKPEEIGAVSGLVPQLGQPEFRRSIEKVKPIISRIDFNGEGEMTYIGDDTGYVYDKKTILPSHHLRSSFMIRRKAFEEVGGYSLGFSPTGFREESDFSLKLLMKGYKLFVDTGAIAWHNASPTGGVRSDDYMQRVQRDDYSFRRKFKYFWQQGKLTEEMLK